MYDPDEAVCMDELGDMKERIFVVVDFYRRFSNKLLNMMDTNPNANLINFENGL